MQRRLSAHYAYIYAHFSLFDVFTVALQAPGRAWNRVVQFWQGGARLWQSPLQHLPVQFTRGKLRLVGEVSPFDSEFTVRDHSLASEWDSVSLSFGRGVPDAEWDSALKLAEDHSFFQGGVIVHFLKNTCLRTMECLHCELKAFSDCTYIHA